MLLLKLAKTPQLGFASEAGILKRTDSFYHASSNKPNATARGSYYILFFTLAFPLNICFSVTVCPSCPYFTFYP